jgi:hypothetical protein
MRAFANELQERLDSYGPLLDKIITQLNALLEYATDPALQLVEEVMKLRIARDSLLGQLQRACEECKALRAELSKVEARSRQDHYVKNHAESMVHKLRAELVELTALREHDIKSLKGELAAKDRLHEEAIDKLRAEHSAEKAKLRAAHNIEMNELRRNAEKAANRPIPSKDQSRQEEFAQLLSQSSPLQEASINAKKKR